MFDAKSNKHQLLFFALVLTLTLVLLPSPGSAQTVTGSLQGTVYDSKGAVVAGVDILVRNLDTGQERSVRTNSEGIYVAQNLLPGLPRPVYKVSPIRNLNLQLLLPKENTK